MMMDYQISFSFSIDADAWRRWEEEMEELYRSVLIMPRFNATAWLYEMDPPKVLKYPNDCPCGIASSRCDYHRDVYV